MKHLNIYSEEAKIMATLTLDIATRIATADQDALMEEVRVKGFPSPQALIMSVVNRLRDAPLTNAFTFKSEKIADENGNVRLNYNGLVAARWEDEQGILYLAINNGDIVKVLPL
jgi:hypothetical protein